MNIQEINKEYDRIIGWLDRKELKLAFDGILGLMAGCNEYSWQDKLNGLQDICCITGWKAYKIRCRNRFIKRY